MADTPLVPQQPPPPPAALVPVYKTIITWKDGQPVMAAEERMRVIVAALDQHLELRDAGRTLLWWAALLEPGPRLLGPLDGGGSHSGCNTLLDLAVLIPGFGRVAQVDRPGDQFGHRGRQQAL